MEDDAVALLQAGRDLGFLSRLMVDFDRGAADTIAVHLEHGPIGSVPKQRTGGHLDRALRLPDHDPDFHSEGIAEGRPGSRWLDKVEQDVHPLLLDTER